MLQVVISNRERIIMPKIDQIYAFVAILDDSDEEVILNLSCIGGRKMPMVSNDLKKIEGLKIIADNISRVLFVNYKIMRYKLDGELK